MCSGPPTFALLTVPLYFKYKKFINVVVFLGLGGKSPIRLQEGGRGGEVLRHHLQRPR